MSHHKTRWTVLALSWSAAWMMTACAEDISDDTKVSELDEVQVTSLCEEVCADAAPWSLECPADGGTITLTGEGKAECTSGCLSIKSVKASCTVTAGDVRKLGNKPASCAEAEVQIGVGLQLLLCTQ